MQEAQAKGSGHEVEFLVNDKSVRMIGPRVTGLAIKEAAIAQGVQIAVDFLLSEELGAGHTKIIGDTDPVTINKNSRFDAVAGDDNS